MNFDPELRLNKTSQYFLFLTLFLSVFGLGTQFYLITVNRKVSIAETVVRYFSYFTILTNLIVAICCIILFIGKKSKVYNFFSKAATLTAITVYIVVVGIIFNILLRPVFDLGGIEQLCSDILHVVIPMFFFLFWLMVVPKQNLQWCNAFPWLIYPVVYMVYTFIRGLMTNFYPYPFVDITKIGYSKALINATLILIVFILLSLIFIGFGKIPNKTSTVE